MIPSSLKFPQHTSTLYNTALSIIFFAQIGDITFLQTSATFNECRIAYKTFTAQKNRNKRFITFFACLQ